MLFVFYKCFRVLYVGLYFYFAPFFAILASTIIPVIYRNSDKNIYFGCSNPNPGPWKYTYTTLLNTSINLNLNKLSHTLYLKCVVGQLILILN